MEVNPEETDLVDWSDEVTAEADSPTQIDRFRGCLLGLAVGDAIGTTLEFRCRGTFDPIEDMVGGGPFGLRPGEWTDDTSMALCLASSLVECQGFDADDQMRRYCQWLASGYMSCNGRCFDVGNTTLDALNAYPETRRPFSGRTDERSAGNGSIMRLAPIPMYYFPDLQETLLYSAESSRTTHGATECLEACRMLGEILFRALSGLPKEEILQAPFSSAFTSSGIRSIAKTEYAAPIISEDLIKGSGYVVESLEAALWCFHRTDCFESAVLRAANLGDDADTTAAVCGQVAGAFYGASTIPPRWLERLAMRELIIDLADQLEARRSPDGKEN